MLLKPNSHVCDRRKLANNKRKGIRFPVMTEHEFADVVLDSKILTPDECFTVVKYFNSIRKNPVGFPETKRTGLKELFERCCRFGSVDHTGSGYPYVPGKRDCLIFTVDKDISLLGVTLCGSKDGNYSVDIRVKDVDKLKSNILGQISGKFSSVCIKSKVGSYYGFNVFFGIPVDIKGSVRYRVEACISDGANSCFGQNGQYSVLCSGVRFEFEDSCQSSNGTHVSRGQFPGFLFTVK